MEKNPQDKKAKVAVHCAGGTRSRVVASFMKSVGFTDVINLSDGYCKMVANGMKSIPKEKKHDWIQ